MKIKKILVANRSEIAIRVFRAANELNIKTVACYAEEDKLALHRFKADEAYLIGKGKGPVEAYLQIDEYIRVARLSGADAIHPGYGLLSESPEFADACEDAGIIFIGPKAQTMRDLGNKVAARNMAIASGVPVVPATDALPDDMNVVRKLAAEIGYPLMLKASWGGGGRGMRRIMDELTLVAEVSEGKREAKAAFGKDEMYLEKLIERARHVEVQIIGDDHGHLVHLFERDCSVQRRNQKVVERAPAPYLSQEVRDDLTGAALKLGNAASYRAAGTVEFLLDADTDKFYFIEVNPRIQVEHTVTEVVTGIDIVKAQIHMMEGAVIGTPESGVPLQGDIRLNGNAIQCRITTEDPEENFIPDYGRITAYREATGFGVRLDGGTAYAGAIITRFYDPLLEKVTCWAPSPEEAIARMNRALREFRIRGVSTNLAFLENIITHPDFVNNRYTTRFIDTTPALFEFTRRKDRATKLLTYIADVTVNGHPEVRDRARPPAEAALPVVPEYEPLLIVEGTRQVLERGGAKGLALWLKNQKRVLFTDTTMRDAHQSLLATRMRSDDITRIAPAYSRGLPGLFSLECWGGATFDVAMRFLNEDPWERLAAVRDGAPNLLTQMLLRGSNGVGYTNYPDNVVKFFVAQAAKGGVDVFRIFDCLNWVENMRVSIDAVVESGKVAETAICYTGDLFDPARAKYDLKYYVGLAKELEAAGRPYPCDQGYGGAAEAGRGEEADRDAEAGSLAADPPPYPRHLGRFGGDGAGGGRGRRRRGGCGDGCAFGHDLAADAGLAGRGARGRAARSRARSSDDPRDLVLLGGGAHAVSRVRERSPLGRVRGLSPRNAGRAVHQSQGAGAFARARVALARGRPHLCRRQPDVRRHREGDAELEGRRRHGAGDGVVGADARRRRGPGPRGCVPGLGGRVLCGRAGPAAGRLSEGAAGEGAEGQGADDQAARLLSQGCRSRGRAGQGGRGQRHGDRRSPPCVVPHVPEGVHRVRPHAGPLRADGGAADAGLFLRPPAGRRDLRRDRARQDSSSSTISDAPRPTKRARSASSSISTASRAASRCRTG